MRKLIVAVALAVMLPMLVWSTDIGITYVDTIKSADTAIEAVLVDTLYSDAFRINQRYLAFYQVLSAPGGPWGPGIDLTNDTFFFKLQHTFDLSNWITVSTELDTLTDVGQGASTTLLDRDATVIGSWGRLMFIHWDSVEATSPDSLNLVRQLEAKLYISGN